MGHVAVDNTTMGVSWWMIQTRDTPWIYRQGTQTSRKDCVQEDESHELTLCKIDLWGGSHRLREVAIIGIKAVFKSETKPQKHPLMLSTPRKFRHEGNVLFKRQNVRIYRRGQQQVGTSNCQQLHLAHPYPPWVLAPAAASPEGIS